MAHCQVDIEERLFYSSECQYCLQEVGMLKTVFENFGTGYHIIKLNLSYNLAFSEKNIILLLLNI